MLSRRALVIAWLSLSLTGCFEHRTLVLDAGIDESEDLADWLASVRTEICRREVECSPLFWWDTFGESAEACHPGVPVFFELNEAVERRARGELRFDPERAEACLTILREGRGCLDGLDGSFDSTCRAVFASATPLGAACDPRDSWCATGLHCDARSCRCEAVRVLGERCVDDSECSVEQVCAAAEEPELRRCEEWRCASDLQCDDSEICADGACIAAVPGADGEACAGEIHQLCRDGLTCGPGAICGPLAARGEPCSTTTGSCESPLVCLDGACGPRPTAGERCREHVQCAADVPHCVDRPIAGWGTCSASPVGRWCWLDIAFGVEATAYGTEAEACPPDLICAPYAEWRFGDWMGGCQPRAGRFEACASSAMCPESTRCEGARCVPVLIPGSDAACGPDALCPPSHACVDARCVPRPMIGERCDDVQRCMRGVCVDGTCRGLDPGEPCERGGTPYQCATGWCSAEGHCPGGHEETLPCNAHDDCAEGRVCVPTEAATTCEPLLCGD